MSNRVPHQLVVMRALTAHLEGTAGPMGDEAVPPEDTVMLPDMTGHVFRGRKFYADEDFRDVGDVALTILEAPRPLLGSTGGVERRERNETWTLLLQGWMKDDKLHPSDPAYWLKAATEARLTRLIERDSEGDAKYPEEFRLGGLFVDMNIGQGLVRPPENITRFTMFYIPLAIQLVTNTATPYVLTT